MTFRVGQEEGLNLSIVEAVHLHRLPKQEIIEPNFLWFNS